MRTPKQIQNVGGYLDSENAQNTESQFAIGPRDYSRPALFCFQREGSSVMHAEVSKYADWPDSRGWTRWLSQSGAHAFVHLAQAARRCCGLVEWL